MYPRSGDIPEGVIYGLPIERLAETARRSIGLIATRCVLASPAPLW
jgi:hypothetical protein